MDFRKVPSGHTVIVLEERPPGSSHGAFGDSDGAVAPRLRQNHGPQGLVMIRQLREAALHSTAPLGRRLPTFGHQPSPEPLSPREVVARAPRAPSASSALRLRQHLMARRCQGGVLSLLGTSPDQSRSHQAHTRVASRTPQIVLTLSPQGHRDAGKATPHCQAQQALHVAITHSVTSLSPSVVFTPSSPSAGGRGLFKGVDHANTRIMQDDSQSETGVHRGTSSRPSCLAMPSRYHKC
ncbi:hypothetical protein NDU88_005994 [Pleurodeles waltl]|uniref:Uncharacterized protein n=1 Tax=Pleurodeles waltl TaxID=8319 RepID=A0AAV7LR51_PLEWA|nr:hypothetical protein NDU88_005994 [Pleurodeles waltl]